MPQTVIHRHEARDAGTPVNAYVIEGAAGVVVVDATLTVPGGRGLRARVDAIGKPMLGVIITHAHPDHYGGLVELTRDLTVPVFSTQLVHDVIRRDDPVKEAVLRPMFGDLWAVERAFPNEVVADGETIALGDVVLSVTDLGPSESPADSIWTLGPDGRRVFSADLAYNGTHAYLADGFYAEWLGNLAAQRRALPRGATLCPGHGGPTGVGALDDQQRYIETFLEAAGRVDRATDPGRARAAVAAAMRALRPTEELAFLMELSVEPIVAKVGGRG